MEAINTGMNTLEAQAERGSAAWSKIYRSDLND